MSLPILDAPTGPVRVVESPAVARLTDEAVEHVRKQPPPQRWLLGKGGPRVKLATARTPGPLPGMTECEVRWWEVTA